MARILHLIRETLKNSMLVTTVRGQKAYTLCSVEFTDRTCILHLTSET